MCVLASAVDIFSSHPLRGGDWLPSWSPSRFVLYESARGGIMCNVYMVFIDIFAVQVRSWMECCYYESHFKGDIL